MHNKSGEPMPKDFNNTQQPNWPQDQRAAPGGGGAPSPYVTHAELEQRLAAGREHMIAHFDGRFDSLEKMIKDGFPGGDPRGHREAHEGQIERANNRKALWKSVWEKLVGGTVISALIFVGQAAWSKFLALLPVVPK